MDSPNAVPLFLGKRLLLSFNPLSGHRSGLQCSALRLVHIWGCVFRHCSASLALPASDLIRPLLTPPRYSAPVSKRPASILRSTGEASRGKTRYLRCIDAGFMTEGNPRGIKHILLPQMEDFAVTCPLVPNVPHLISGSCSSSRSFGLGFLQTPPRDDALALLLAFGSAKPGHRTFTYEVTRHARRTRPSSPDRALFARFRWSALLDGSSLNLHHLWILSVHKHEAPAEEGLLSKVVKDIPTERCNYDLTCGESLLMVFVDG